MNYVAVIPARVSGIPCQIGIESYHRQNPDSGNWESDWDALGYTECCWSVLDRRGREAAWLERKITEKEKDRIEEMIDAHFDRRWDDDDGQ